MKNIISTNFVARCKDRKYLTYAVFDKMSDEWVDGTESPNLVEVQQWAKDLNIEEDRKQLTIK